MTVKEYAQELERMGEDYLEILGFPTTKEYWALGVRKRNKAMTLVAKRHGVSTARLAEFLTYRWSKRFH